MSMLSRLFQKDPDVALQRIEAHLIKLHEEIRTVMSTAKSQFDALVGALNTETNTLATRLDALKTQLIDALANGNRTMTVDETTAVLGELSDISGRLQVLGANPAEPIPPSDNPPVPATAG